MRKNLVKIIIGIVLIAVLITAIFCTELIPNLQKQYIYKIKYSSIVEEYSEKYNIDKYIIYSVIKTESSFNKKATSDVGARGLMQMMPDTFEWVKYKMDDTTEMTFNNMYEPECSIKYGAYLMSYLMKKFNNVQFAAMAYHAGITQAMTWIENNDIVFDDNNNIKSLPSDVTLHYVNKITKSYNRYKKLYG